MNERLTRVGPGTPGGELLRRYWWPVATATELAQEPVLSVKVLGENLALYRTDEGKLGLVSQRCPHRGASLAYGIPEEEGLRCPYHGWRFDQTGQCNDMPAEPEDSTFKHRIKIPAYPVQEMGGLIWAYLGPEPVPLLPRFDLYVRPGLKREIGISRLGCNWVQTMENSLDPVHLEFLHGLLTNYVLKRQGKAAAADIRKHLKIAFDVWEFGISKRRLLEGQTEDDDDWRTGHPILFPHTLAVGASDRAQFQIRVPVDDTNTLHFWYWTRDLPPGEPEQKPDEIPVSDNPFVHSNGRLMVETVNSQDMMAWITQGPVSDRTTERLGTTDKGVILFRNLLFEAMEKVQRGEDPMGVVRDSARNQPWIEVPREHKAHYVVGGFISRNSEAVAAAHHDAVTP